MVFVVEGSGGKPEMVPQMTREGQKLKMDSGKKVGEEDKLLQFPIVFSHSIPLNETCSFSVCRRMK